METHFIDLQDIHKASFLMMHHIEPELIKNQDGRVVFRVLGDEETRRLLVEYEENPGVRLLNFVTMLKRARGRMLDVRDGYGRDGERRYGNGNSRTSSF
jgi:hypothetical protein